MMQARDLSWRLWQLVAGTEKQHVADDYEKRLYIGMESAQEVIKYINIYV